MAARTTTNGTRKPAQRAGKPASKTVTIPKPMLTAAQNTVDIDIPDEPDSVLRFITEVKPEDTPFAERELVFSVDGVDYTAPVEVPASWGLQFLRAQIAYNIDFAVIWAMEMALGSAAVDKLTSIPDLTSEQLNVITQRITQKFVDSTSLPKGQSKNG